jgi:hypothetical protein
MITFIRSHGDYNKIQALDAFSRCELDKELSYWRIDQNLNGLSSGLELPVSNLSHHQISPGIHNTHVERPRSPLLNRSPQLTNLTGDIHRSSILSLL